MKKISALIFSAFLAVAAASAQNVTVTADSAKLQMTVSADSALTTATALADEVPLESEEPAETPMVIREEGRWKVSYDGETYSLAELVKDSKFADKMNALDELDSESLILKDNMGMAAVIVAIIFGLPCITIIVGLIVILLYALKRNRGRNALINNAIEHDYQLPDAFYLNQKAGVGANMPVRDSRKFYSATTLMAIGLSLIIFAIYADAKFFVVLGGIPFLIGIGQMIGYYCVPNTDPRGMHRNCPPRFDNGYMNGPSYNYQQPAQQYDYPQAPYSAPSPSQAPAQAYPSECAGEQSASTPSMPQVNQSAQTPPPYNPS